jgi:hypothetical protein
MGNNVATLTGSTLICFVLPCFTTLYHHTATWSISSSSSSEAPKHSVWDEEWQALLVLETVLLNAAWFTILALQASWWWHSVWTSWQPMLHAILLLGSIFVGVQCLRRQANSPTQHGTSKTRKTASKTIRGATTAHPVQPRRRPYVIVAQTKANFRCVLRQLRHVNANRRRTTARQELALQTARHVTPASPHWTRAYYAFYHALQAMHHVSIFTNVDQHQALLTAANAELVEALSESTVSTRTRRASF